MPSYDLILVLAEHLEPKTLQLRAWRISETIISSNMDKVCQRRSTCQCFMSLSVGNQLFAVLICFRR